jgi:hypothetical protein
MGVLGQHLIDGHSISDWCYQENPHSTIWIKRDDGALLSLSYLPEYNVMAWASHEIAGGGLVVSMCCTPGALAEDSVWLAVSRDGVISIERLAYRLFTDIRDAVFLDRSATYNGLQSGTMAITTAADYAIGDQVPVTLSGGAGLVTARSSTTNGGIVRVDAADGGLAWRFECLSDDGGGAYTMQLESRNMASADCFGASDWWICRSSVSCPHLAGQTVTVVADGEVWPEVVVSGTSASIGEGNEAGMLHVGLPYNSDFQSLGIANDREKEKIIEAVMVEIEHTRGGSVGADFDHLVDIRTREVEHGYLPIPEVRRDVDALVVSKWGKGGEVCVRQSEPMPMTILGIMRKYHLGG